MAKSKAYFDKRIIDRISGNSMPAHKSRELARVISDLDNVPMSILRIAGRVRKVNDSDGGKYYVYRMNPHDRVLFSVADGEKTICDIIDVRSKKSILKAIKTHKK